MTTSIFTQIGSDIDGEAIGDQSGNSVSLSSDGSVVAIGATSNDGNGNGSGHVRIYQNSNGTWTKVGDDSDGEAADDYSGRSVSLSADGSVVAIGAAENDGNGSDSGHVRIYQNVNNTWTKIGDDIDGEASYDESGYSVSLSADGTVVAIGAPHNDGNGNESGHVRIYQNIDNTWTQVGSDIDGEAASDYSGSSVSLSSDGSVVAIGAYGNAGNGILSGHVRIYQNVDNTWTKIGNDIDGEAAGDSSGWSVSLSADGSVIAIGADGNDDNGDESGHVRIYQNIDGTWTQVGSDIDGEAARNYSGWSVGLSADGSVIAIGADGNDDNGSDSGHVRIYQNIDGTWTQVGSDIDGEAANDYSGGSISLSSDGSIVAIGATYNDGNGASSGHVRIYETGISSGPLITGPSGSAGDGSSSTSIDENSTAIHTFTANESVTWSLNGGSDQDLFTINSTTGALNFSSAPDYENPTDTGTNNTYSVIVRAIDAAGRMSDQTVTTTITDVDEIVPSITGPSGNAGDGTSSISIDENTTAVHTFTSNESVTWSLSGGADQDLFSINSSTGVLSFSSAPDYENPGDIDTNNNYIVTVRATDTAGNSSDQNASININDLNSPYWNQIGSDIDGEAANNYSGDSVSLSADGSVVAIGAYGNDGNGSYSGHVRIYQNINGTWTQVGSDIKGEAAGDRSGQSVSLSSDGSVVAIGAPGNDGNGSDSGHVRIYQNVNGTWTQVGSDIDGEAGRNLDDNEYGYEYGYGDASGYSVSLSSDGSVVAIGARNNVGNEDNEDPYIDYLGNESGRGHVRIYQNIDDTWTQVGNDINGEAAGDDSGDSISLSADGSVVAIGAASNDGVNGNGSGHVRIYQNINNTWTQVGSDIDGEDYGDQSGTSISLSSDGSIIAIGARMNDGNGNDSGHVRIYQNVNNAWTQVGSDIDGEAAGDFSGESVNLSSDGSIVAIGATSNDGNGNVSGHVRIYQNVNNTWTQIGSDIDGEAVLDYSGRSISLSADGSVVAIGAASNDGVNGNDSGHVRIYQFEDNSAPLITGPSGLSSDSVSSISINENITAVHTFVADEPVVWSLFPSYDSDLFSLNSSTGVLNFNSPPDYETPIDQDTNNVYIVDVRATDSIGLFSDKSITISIADIDEISPVITGPTGSAGESIISISIMENSNLFHDFTANETVNWSLLSSFDSEHFLIDSSRGVLSLKSSLDYERAIDQDSNNIYIVDVRATDSVGHTSEQKVFIAVTDIVDETSPNISGPSGSAGDGTSSISINENTTTIHTFTASETVTWSLNGGADQDLFTIDSSTGTLSFSSAPDYENPTDTDSNNSYVVSVRATDSVGNTSDQTVTTTLSDVDEPIITGPAGLAGDSEINISINENTLNSFTFAASDSSSQTGDFDSNDMTWSISGGVDMILFGGKLNAQSGVLLFGPADYENPSDSDSNNTYIVNVRATNTLGVFSDQIVTFSVNDVEESGGFDALLYIASNPDLIAVFGTDTTAATDHYNNFGQAEGRSLDSFNVDLYLTNYSDLSAAFGSNTTAATQHYISSGYSEGRTAEFTEASALSYIASNPDLINAFGTDTEAAIAHYTSNGQAEGRSFNSFSASNYLANYADLAAAFGSDTAAATRHYITSGYAEGRTAQLNGSSSIQSLSSAKVIDTLTEFETLNYIASHDDLITAFGTNTTAAEDHYNDFGEAEGRALDTFDEWGYIASHNDLLNTFGSDTTAAVEHYISFGMSEGRGTDGFNASSYLNSYTDLSNAFGDNQDLATKHFVEHGFAEGRTVVA